MADDKSKDQPQRQPEPRPEPTREAPRPIPGRDKYGELERPRPTDSEGPQAHDGGEDKE